ncbi:hypothetical protein A9986_13585 [Solibacillus silvestris]|nr:hypothetical protein A9986_13585 [Solibacillus silvestris]
METITSKIPLPIITDLKVVITNTITPDITPNIEKIFKNLLSFLVYISKKNINNIVTVILRIPIFISGCFKAGIKFIKNANKYVPIKIIKSLLFIVTLLLFMNTLSNLLIFKFSQKDFQTEIFPKFE